jgi:3-dehydroquinate dehydratase-1
MTFKICIPFFDCSLKGIDEQSIQEADMLELYIDSLHADTEELVSFAQSVLQQDKQIIITLRRPQFAEQKNTFTQRIELLKKFITLPVLFDLDIYKEKEEILFLVEQGVSSQLIASYHHYASTPSSEELSVIRKEALQYSPGFIKFSTIVHTEQEMHRLVSLSLECVTSSMPWIVSPMGRFGKQGRIITGLLGSAWTYAKSGSSTAEGQLGLEDCASIRALLSR